MEALGHNATLIGDNFTLGCRPFASLTPCAHVVGNPSCEFNNIDYLRFYFCHEDVDDFPPALKQPVLVLWTVVLLAVRMRERSREQIWTREKDETRRAPHVHVQPPLFLCFVCMHRFV